MFQINVLTLIFKQRWTLSASQILSKSWWPPCTATTGGALVAREISDRRFPKGLLVLASLRNRQLPVVAHAFSEHLRTALGAEVSVTLNPARTSA